MATYRMAPEIPRLIDFLKGAGYSEIAKNIEDASPLAATIRSKVDFGVNTSDKLKFLDIQARFEEALQTIDWLRE